MVAEQHLNTTSMAETARILVVEDEPLVRELICTQLSRDGTVSQGASTGEEALALIDRERFDLILLDVRLPGMSGIEACRQIRARSDVPVVFVTAAASLQERLEGFDAGADDYIIKPVEILELNRRIRAILRRRGGWHETPDELAGPAGVVMHLRAHETLIDDRVVDLTPKEFAVLRLMLERRGEVLKTDTISTQIWGYETFGSRNFVEAHISRLRAKLLQAGADGVITTVRGIGYVIR